MSLGGGPWDVPLMVAGGLLGVFGLVRAWGVVRGFVS